MTIKKVGLSPSNEVDLQLEGKHHGYIRIMFSADRSAYGWIPVPLMSIKNGKGPCALLIGANHGDEYEGVSIINEIYKAHPNDFEFKDDFFDKLYGSNDLRLAILESKNLDELIKKNEKDIEKFKKLREKVLLY